SGDELDAEALGFPARQRDAGQRVVIGQGEGIDSGGGHFRDQLGRRIQTVGNAGVSVEVDAHRARRIVSPVRRHRPWEGTFGEGWGATKSRESNASTTRLMRPR